MHQGKFNKRRDNGWRKEVHGTKDQNVLADDVTNMRLIIMRYYVG